MLSENHVGELAPSITMLTMTITRTVAGLESMAWLQAALSRKVWSALIDTDIQAEWC